MKNYFNSKDARTLIDVYGFALFPVHGIDDNGNCTCGNPDCTNKGKHPASEHGANDASKDIEAVKALWAGRKGLNVGIATGAVSNVMVIDIDGPDGEEAIKPYNLPETLTSVTGRGRHLFFAYPGFHIKTKRGILPHVDVRGDGGYVCGPGSNHYSGVTYQWKNPLESIVDAPKELLDLIVAEPKRKTLAENQAFKSLLSASPPRIYRPEMMSEAEVSEMLQTIDPDLGYDEWIAIGMALHDGGYPFQLWDYWSKRGTKYDGQTASHWKSFHGGGGISMGSLVKMANDAGYQRTKTVKTENKSFSVALTNSVNDGKEIDKTDKTDETYSQETDTNSGNIRQSQETTVKTIHYINAQDIELDLTANDLVHGYFGNGQFSVIYGESNCGKTFFMTDVAFHVALGVPWCEERVDGGIVVYAAMEGATGLTKRIAAYRKRHNVNLKNFFVVPCQVNFMDDKGNINEFLNVLKELMDLYGPIKLIVIDTLARAMAGGDENSGQDMSVLVYHADRLRYETGAHISFVHHSGKDRLKGARGHSSLRAAVDTEIEIHRPEGADYSTVTIEKQREMEMGSPKAFQLEAVNLGVNEYREAVSSCVVNYIDYEAVKQTRKDKLTPAQQFVYDAILFQMAECGVDRLVDKDGTYMKTITYEQLRERLEHQGLKDEIDPTKIKNVTSNARVALKAKNKIGFDQGLIWLI